MTTTQLIIILFAIGFSFLSWLVGKIREQAEINRVQRERTRRREEELRTGRPQTEQQQSGVRLPAELQTLAERRQQQLRALREQQMQRMRGPQAGRSTQSPQAPQAGPAPARGASTSETSWQAKQTQSAGRQHEMRTPTPMRPTTLKSSHPQTPHQSRTAGRESMRTPTPMRDQRLQPPAQKPPSAQRPASSQRMSSQPMRRSQVRPLQISPGPEAPKRSMSPYEQAVHEQRAQDKLDKSAATTAIAGSMAFELRNMTREDWRRAIVLREILNPPITERGEDAQPGTAY